jgi:hypothetical protein
VVPDGVEEVELAKINLEQRERERKLLLDDIRYLAGTGDSHTGHLSAENDNSFWMINSGKASLVNILTLYDLFRIDNQFSLQCPVSYEH